jgi:polar amino acid transport system permease protein
MYFFEQLANFKFYLLGLYPAGAMGGLIVNLLLVVIAISVSFFIGILLGYGRLSKIIFIKYPFGWFIDIVRSTPLVMIIFWIYFFLPSFGIQMSLFTSVEIALCVYASAVQAEIVRAGILAIPKGQMEAAVTIGLSKLQAMRHIIFRRRSEL